MVCNNTQLKTTADSPLVAVAAFGRSIGRSRPCLWRWEQKGWLDKPINVAGRPYYTRESIDRFAARAAAGEFAQKPHVPRKEKASVQ